MRFLRVLDAGHMVPMNQPEVASQMLKDLLGGRILEPQEPIE